MSDRIFSILNYLTAICISVCLLSIFDIIQIPNYLSVILVAFAAWNWGFHRGWNYCCRETKRRFDKSWREWRTQS